MLQDANVKLSSALSDIFGVSGQLMLEALLEGKAQPAEIAQFAQRRAQRKIPQIVAALEGHRRSDHHRQMICYSLEHLRFLEEHISDLDEQIVAKIEALGYTPQWQLLPTAPGLKENSAASVLAEIGPDMGQFGSEKKLSSWAGVCPGNNRSAGKNMGSDHQREPLVARRAHRVRLARRSVEVRLLGCALALATAAAYGAEYVRSKACAPCHSAQYASFQKTPMGRSFAEVTFAAAPELSKPAQFFHPKTGRRYRVFRKPGEFLIEEFFADKDRRLVYSDPRRVSYAIGSGNHARSFLVERPGRLYQAPITFFERAGRWDMSPGYDTDSYVGFTREVTGNCLFCHSGRGNTGDTSIGCERCHGPGERHVVRPSGAIVNPAKLPTDLRDQVCEQCHLFGAARVTQPGKSPADYRPGEPLSAVLAVYDYEGSTATAPTVTGHSQEMKQSVCRQRSQGKLWCGSCHEVHAKTPYRTKCLNCHAPNACSRKPDPSSAAHRENDCIACHMPKRPVLESAHVTFTDHRILRRPKPDRQTHSEELKLRAILPTELDDPVVATRNLGFAYAALASSTGRKEFHRKVVDILRPLDGTKVADAAFWQTLAEAHLSLEEGTRAEEAFRMATGLEPGAASAHYGLGYVFQLRGSLPEAIQAYRRAIEADPFKAEAFGNLAAAYSDMGQQEKAVEALKAALKLEPGNLRWRAIQSSGGSGYRNRIR